MLLRPVRARVCLCWVGACVCSFVNVSMSFVEGASHVNHNGSTTWLATSHSHMGLRIYFALKRRVCVFRLQKWHVAQANMCKSK